MRLLKSLSGTMVFLAAAAALSTAETKVKGADVAINGESFFAAANITSELTRLARADGYIGASESFRQIAVSGAVMTGILKQYKDCTPKPVFVITDGGGNDLMGSCGGTATPECAAIKAALNTVKEYFTTMNSSGTKKVIWMRYPDPVGTNWATLKTNQDVYNPEVEKICKASTAPKCQWIDMRKTWEGHYAQYTQDGIHPTPAGGTATAEAFWKFAKDSSFFDLGSGTGTKASFATAPSAFRGQRVANQTLELSVSFDHPTAVTLRMMNLTGQVVLNTHSQAVSGAQTLRFPVGSVVPGVYRLELDAGPANKLSSLLIL